MIHKALLLILLSAALAIPVPASAETLSIGVFPRRGAEKTIQAYTPLIEYLAKKSGLDLRLEVPPDMPSFWNRLRNGRYDIAHMNQYHYVRAHSEIGYRVVLKNEEFGKDTIASAIWVHEDSPVTKLTDLKGKWIVFGGGKQAMVASIMARDLLQQAGLESRDYFSRTTLYPLDALGSLYYRRVDAAGVGDVADRIPVVIKTIGKGTLRIVARSEPVTHLPWAVSHELDDEAVKSFVAAFLSLNDSHAGKQLLNKLSMTGIRRAGDQEYDTSRDIILRVLGENYFAPDHEAAAQ